MCLAGFCRNEKCFLFILPTFAFQLKLIYFVCLQLSFENKTFLPGAASTASSRLKRLFCYSKSSSNIQNEIQWKIIGLVMVVDASNHTPEYNTQVLLKIRFTASPCHLLSGHVISCNKPCNPSLSGESMYL